VTDTETLLAIEAIKRLKARYFRCVDAKDWLGFMSVSADDAVFDISDDMPGCVLVGPERIVEPPRVGLQDCVSVHHGHCPEIDIVCDTEATGVWAMEDMLRWTPESATPGRRLHGYGHYFETYEKRDVVWKIKSLKLKRLRVDVRDPQ